MKSVKKNTLSGSSKSTKVCNGVFTKEQAAKLIAGGVRHLHSTQLGKEDPCFKLTSAALTKNQFPKFPWQVDQVKTVYVKNSCEREKAITQAITELGLDQKRKLSEKVRCVLEELISNAIYHSYKLADGSEKYPRMQAANLSEQERIEVGYAANAQGVYLTVRDFGGTLNFETMSSALGRCYGGNPQIETKEGGAGLGLYMVFDAVTHLKVESTSQKSTLITLWIADKHSYQENVFSFNFFGGKTS